MPTLDYNTYHQTSPQLELMIPKGSKEVDCIKRDNFKSISVQCPGTTLTLKVSLKETPETEADWFTVNETAASFVTINFPIIWLRITTATAVTKDTPVYIYSHLARR